MTILKHTAAAFLGISAFLAACQSSGVSFKPAVLKTADNQTISNLKSALADALGVASVELGPGDLTKQSTISVLPPRLGVYENNSVAMPVIFDLLLKGDACIVRQQNNGREYPLGDVPCEPLKD